MAFKFTKPLTASVHCTFQNTLGFGVLCAEFLCGPCGKKKESSYQKVVGYYIVTNQNYPNRGIDLSQCEPVPIGCSIVLADKSFLFVSAYKYDGPQAVGEFESETKEFEEAKSALNLVAETLRITPQ